MNKKHFVICYRVTDSTDTASVDVYANDKDDALRAFKDWYPYNIVLACWDETGKNLGVC